MIFQAGDPDWARTKKTLKTVRQLQKDIDKLLRELEGKLDGESRRRLEEISEGLSSGEISVNEALESIDSNPYLRGVYEDSASESNEPETVEGVDSDGNPVSGEVETYIFGKPAVRVDGELKVVSETGSS